MKIKQLPEDFVVEEISNFSIKDKGEYSIYKLTKTSLDFIQAKRIIKNKFNLNYDDLGYAGIKDKYAKTTQLMSIKTNLGKKLNFKEQNIQLEHLGFSDKPLKSGDLLKNKFIITIRDLKDNDISSIKNNLDIIKEYGVPNYFDSQRFGSLIGTNEFIAKRLIKGDYEGALKIQLTSLSRHFNKEKRYVHKSIKENWNNWNRCYEIIKDTKWCTEEKRIIRYLKNNPKDFVTAFKLIDKNVKEMFISAYQSYIWNECVKLLLKNKVLKDSLFEAEYQAGKLIFYKELPEELKLTKFPMIDSRLEIENKDFNNIVNEVLNKEGIKQEDLKVKKIKNIFFKARDRSIIVFPDDLDLVSIDNDEVNKNKKKARIQFSLDKGSYATLIIKRLTY